ncbi:MAG: aspartate--tRNA ligase, partial [Candidatus Omnitrophica bacterium]|nr:aspartate--tRNA ligase [Candidatus Omnitrophota bacterium]
MLRTHTCGELTLKDVDKEVFLCGWVATRRDHGKLIFVDLRDRWGITQIVFNPKDSSSNYEKAQELRNEFVIRVRGKVCKRPPGTINPRIPTGEIEIVALDLEILNPSLSLPFEIEENLNVNEELRLRYRYLDLRRRKILNNFMLRHNLYQTIRHFLNKEGFLEFETPILTKSTPEGARDFLVPCRLNRGKFYALPQSPQLFKQILMVAGDDRYYQIARCFRDEDLRADRQPEFTQLDLELSFITQEDIFDLVERLMQNIFKEIKGINLKIPFKRMNFSEAQKKYGTDKPDLRKEFKEDFAFIWIVDFPLLKYNQEEKRWEAEHHPFTSPHPQDLELLEKEPQKVRALAYDLVLNGIELGSGSIRIHKPEIQERVFKIIGIDKEQAQKRFGFLLEAFKYGAP